MKTIFRLMTAGLLVCLIFPQLVQAGGDLGEDPYEIGEKLFAKKNFKTALKYYQKSLARNDVRAYYRLGLIYEAAGKEEEALNHYRRFMDLGQPAMQQSDAAQRASAIEERLNRRATRSTELLERGKILFKKRKYREAERVLRDAASKGTSEPEIHFYLGEVYMQLEEYGKAKSEYKKASGRH